MEEKPSSISFFPNSYLQAIDHRQGVLVPNLPNQSLLEDFFKLTATRFDSRGIGSYSLKARYLRKPGPVVNLFILSI